MQDIGGGLTVALQITPGGSSESSACLLKINQLMLLLTFLTPGGSSRALFGTPGSSGELLRSSSRGLSYYEPSGSSRILDGPAGSSRALLLTPLRDGPMLIGSFFSRHILFSKFVL